MVILDADSTLWPGQMWLNSSHITFLCVKKETQILCWHFNLKFQADIDLHKRAGELSEEEVEKIVTIMQNPRQYKIPNWFLNRQKDIKDGKIYIHFFSSLIKPNYFKIQQFSSSFLLTWNSAGPKLPWSTTILSRLKPSQNKKDQKIF